MDFLEIRKKARAAKQAEPAAVAVTVAPTVAPEVPRAPEPPAIVTATEGLEAPPPEPMAARESAAPEVPHVVEQSVADPLAGFFFRPDEGEGELADIAADLEPPVEAGPEEAPTEFLGFRLGGEDYAVELARIREIVKVPAITEVPRAPADIAGVMSLRGEVMPVFDVRKRLALPNASQELGRSARVVVVDVGDGPAGVLVDAVHQVVRLKASMIEAPPPGIGSGFEAEYLTGIGRRKERMYLLLNLTAVLGRAPVKAGGRR